jgi:hypothetical protein
MCKEIREKMAQEYRESSEKERQRKYELLEKWKEGKIELEEAQELINFLEKDIKSFETQKNWEGLIITTLLKMGLRWHIEFNLKTSK